ncbi:MAG: hypothetical protein K0S29_1231 [Gammaproteobacteria bacterium]|jgi:hypothetical protein|nr:hypothetical protein [Gammaproteobacteria bacterium]
MTVSQFELLEKKCKLGIKAFHNIFLAAQLFEQLKVNLNSHNSLLLMSYFSTAVIRYCSPFVDSRKGTRYSLKALKRIDGYSAELHSNLLMLRNKLLAHDDLEEIEPKILTRGFGFHTGENVVVDIHVLNGTISHIITAEKLDKLINQTNIVLLGVRQNLLDDIQAYQKFIISNPEHMANAKYQKTEKLNINQGRFTPASISNETWLNTLNIPAWLNVSDEYVYQWITIGKCFAEQEIILPSGIIIKP